METIFAFGKEGLRVTLPEGPRYRLILSRSSGPVANPVEAIESALDAPIGRLPLVELARGRKSAAISVCDITRPAPNRTTLPPLLERLHRAGIPREAVTIMIATGLHRQATEDELNTVLGPEIAARYRIGNHDARDREAHRSLGTTRRGTPVTIDERFMAADLHITLGFIEQHLMLGFSGGRKLVAPGVAGEETIRTIHSPRFMREPAATEGSIEGNPLHAELLEIAGMAGHDFILDVTMTREREISGVFAGCPVEAHAAGVRFLREHSMERLPEPVDAVITSSAGYPLDLTFYQTIKGITAAEHVVKPGGRILLLGECAEGIGSPDFAEKMRNYGDPEAYLREIEDKPVVPDQWQLEKLALTQRNHEVLFYAPGAAKDQLGSLAGRSYASPGAAIAALLAGVPKDAQVALIPEGPYAYARVEREADREPALSSI
ncbi:MAG: nickel-dependent lactate racemase [Acidobacteriota bacterium]